MVGVEDQELGFRQVEMLSRQLNKTVLRHTQAGDINLGAFSTLILLKAISLNTIINRMGINRAQVSRLSPWAIQQKDKEELKKETEKEREKENKEHVALVAK